MKQQSILLCFLLAFLMFLAACQSVEADKTIDNNDSSNINSSTMEVLEDNTLPRASENLPEGIGGALSSYSEKFELKFSISMSFYELYDEWQEWANQFEHVSEEGTRNRFENNIYNFIHELKIQKDKFIEENQAYSKVMGEPFYTDEEIELLYSDDVETVYSHFANPWGVCIGKEVYTPEWLFEHGAQDYKEVGITSEMLSKKILLIQEEFTVLTNEDKINQVIPSTIETEYIALQRLEGVPEEQLKVPANEVAEQLQKELNAKNDRQSSITTERIGA